jgi:hypothetical protein
MAVKGKHRRGKTKHRKTTSRRHTRRVRTQRRRGCMRGGNYETDVTTRMTEGVPTKPLNKFVVTVPGYGTMSGTAYKNLTEEIDRDGPDAFLK